MPRTHNRRQHLAVLGACLALGLQTACTSMPEKVDTSSGTPKATSQEALLQRARAYWAAIQSNDALAAWPYEEVSQNPNWTLQAYVKRAGGIVYDAIEVREVQSVEGERAGIQIWMKFTVPMVRVKQEGSLIDEWRLINGQWYHVRPTKGAKNTP